MMIDRPRFGVGHHRPPCRSGGSSAVVGRQGPVNGWACPVSADLPLRRLPWVLLLPCLLLSLFGALVVLMVLLPVLVWLGGYCLVLWCGANRPGGAGDLYRSCK